MGVFAELGWVIAELGSPMNADDESVITLEDLRGDLAARYKRTPTSGASVDPAIV